MLTVLHASDLQVGRPYKPEAAQAFVALAHELAPDAIVVSGDLTQRAKMSEYRTAGALLAELPDVPVVVTAGNHDVPLYRVWERLLAPFRNWRATFGSELDTVSRVEGAVFVGLSSAAPRRAVVAGRLRPVQVEFARRAFEAASPEALRILVVHHHFVATPDRKGGRTLPGAAGLLHTFEEMGVSMILGGHVHQTHITTSRALVSGDGPGIPLVACGTTASVRGRGPEVGVNTLNVLRAGRDSVEIATHRLDARSGTFAPGVTTRLPLPGRLSTASESSAGGGA